MMYWHELNGWNLLLTIVCLAAAGLVWTVITVAVAQLIFRVYHPDTGAYSGPESGRSQRILAERFASGDIDRDTYREGLATLRDAR